MIHHHGLSSFAMPGYESHMSEKIAIMMTTEALASARSAVPRSDAIPLCYDSVERSMATIVCL